MIPLIITISIASLLILLFFNLKKNEVKVTQSVAENKEMADQLGKDYLTIFDNDKGFTQLAGVRHQKMNNELNFRINEQVYLIQEPTNKFDSNAIKVINDNGIKIGYISKFHNTELIDLINNGYYFIAVISRINLDEPDYPQATLEITKTKNRNFIPYSDEELLNLTRKGEEVIENFKRDSKNAYEISKKGVEFEKDKNIVEAIKCFEEAILLPNTPPNSYKRLVVYYRKIKDYPNEIRVLNNWIESVQNSRAFGYIKKDEIKEIKSRLKKAQILKNNLLNT
ncbi:MAG: HIRAN domain-containing protein [Bacteroidales bacterium]|nr:HIRAN domain-containing protein [Bacteroidales bacterium]